MTVRMKNQEIIAPIIHLNGDRASTLVADLERGYAGCRAALEALCKCAGNARNFYPDPGRWEKYSAQHCERQLHIHIVMESLIGELGAIQAQEKR